MALRARLTVWYGTALALILIVFATVLYAVLARGLKDQVDQSLQQAALAAVHALENRFGPFLPFEDFSAQFPELAVVDKFFQIFSPTGNITIESANIKAREIPLSPTALEAAFQGKTTYESARFPGEPPLRLVSVPIIYNGTLVNIVRVGTSLQPVEKTLQRLLLVLAVTLPIALLAALAGGWFLAGRALRPVERYHAGCPAYLWWRSDSTAARISVLGRDRTAGSHLQRDDRSARDFLPPGPSVQHGCLA